MAGTMPWAGDPAPAGDSDAGATTTAWPSGTVTFLFTDIEGSTQLWEQHPQAMPPALARHDALLRQAIAAHSGAVFKTVGDSLYAAFATVPAALAAALAAQRALGAEDWTHPGLPAGVRLHVRMVAYTGAAEWQAGDYLGMPLNRAARMLAVGHGGQVPPDVTLRALGAYQLKDLPHPEDIYQLVSPDLVADFPPLRITEAGAAPATARPPLLATKLYMPRARPDLVARPRLCARLDAGLHGVLTLVCAPAGFGKSTLLAEWLSKLKIENGELKKGLSTQTSQFSILNSQFKVAWVSLDAGDNDPTRFWTYAITALDSLHPGAGARALTLLQSPQPPPIEALLTTALNALSAREPRPAAAGPDVFVLDDYQVIETPTIHQAVSFLIDHLPPALHLIIATREDPPLPLARLRARSQVHELRAPQLRFTSAEAEALLIGEMGLPLTAADAAALEARTEGWVAGLQLAALALQDRKDYGGFITAFTGSNRFIVDYLADEVLRRPPAHTNHTHVLHRAVGCETNTP